MSKRSKRFRKIAEKVDSSRFYSIQDAVVTLKECPPTKFDQSVDVALKIGVDPKKSDQNVRGTVSLPNGTGKKIRILVFARGDKVQEALLSGADYAGSDEYIEKVANGWVDFDVVIATPDMMREVGKLGKVLGPRNLMPTPKAGTVTQDVTKAIQELQAGRVEFKVDRYGVVSIALGKLSFLPEKLVENIEAFLQAVWRAKPAAAKGDYMQSLSISSTMGPGLKILPQHLRTL